MLMLTRITHALSEYNNNTGYKKYASYWIGNVDSSIIRVKHYVVLLF